MLEDVALLPIAKTPETVIARQLPRASRGIVRLYGMQLCSASEAWRSQVRMVTIHSIVQYVRRIHRACFYQGDIEKRIVPSFA